MRFAYYPGCTAKSTATAYNESVEETCRLLGIDLEEIPDWNCCGATSGHVTNFELALALPSRNLALAEKESLGMVTPCPACFLRHKEAQFELEKDTQRKARIETNIGMPLGLVQRTEHILEVLFHDIGLDLLQRKLQKSLTGLKAVTYYGCYLVRPPQVTGFDDPENPTIMDKIMGAIGAEVIDWYCKVDCCGGGLALTNPEIAQRLASKITAYALDTEANAIVTACHLCQSNLDTYQRRKGSNHAIPVFFFSELTALALGSLHVKRWSKKHMVNPSSLLDRIQSI